MYLIMLITIIGVAIAVWHIRSVSASGGTGGVVAGNVTVHFIDVGQGDATLIQTGEGNVLIDGGDRRTASALVQYLKDSGVNRLDRVVATHPHADHIAGLANVIDTFEVDTIIMPKVAHTTLTFERLLDAIEKNGVTLQEPVAGDSFTLGDTVFTIVAPNSTGYRNLNNYSVSLRVLHGSVAFLFTGDAEAESENEMLEKRRNISAQVFHVGHHGSKTSNTQAFLDAVSPEIAVISCGTGNTFGHPSEEILERLEEAGVTVYRTDLLGTIVMSSDGSSLTVH